MAVDIHAACKTRSRNRRALDSGFQMEFLYADHALYVKEKQYMADAILPNETDKRRRYVRSGKSVLRRSKFADAFFRCDYYIYGSDRIDVSFRIEVFFKRHNDGLAERIRRFAGKKPIIQSAKNIKEK